MVRHLLNKGLHTVEVLSTRGRLKTRENADWSVLTVRQTQTGTVCDGARASVSNRLLDSAQVAIGPSGTLTVTTDDEVSQGTEVRLTPLKSMEAKSLKSKSVEFTLSEVSVLERRGFGAVLTLNKT